MTAPTFDAEGWDHTTYAPFHLGDGRGKPFHNDGTPPFLLMFYDWDWLFTTYAADLLEEAINGYYLNGPGVEGLVRAVRFASGRYLDESGIFPNSEGDTCIVQLEALDEAVHVAELAADIGQGSDKAAGSNQDRTRPGFRGLSGRTDPGEASPAIVDQKRLRSLPGAQHKVGMKA